MVKGKMKDFRTIMGNGRIDMLFDMYTNDTNEKLVNELKKMTAAEFKEIRK